MRPHRHVLAACLPATRCGLRTFAGSSPEHAPLNMSTRTEAVRRSGRASMD